ncbi:polyprenol phosphomannose-dependent alpha 1,6 mannosyltransferase MptB [Kibdelosporangium banguiense]|nr:polyprenol phosphomannose-dependent alpha 1,6 mannosyltransferase MptB [Kibdelosporangium banguiense]
MTEGVRDKATASEHRALNRAECRKLELIRQFGTTGSLMLLFGSLGAGALPIYNPIITAPVIGLFSRAYSATLAVAFLGMGMLIASWLLLGRYAMPGRPAMISRSQLNRTLMMWGIPLIFTVPLFSRDVYSYLAQGSIVTHGLDPYEVGPGPALGQDHLLTRGVSNMWRETPAPYGPLFLFLSHLLNTVTGDHVITGVLAQRLLALVGIALFVWALPRLAERFGVHPVVALWLGAANPLVLFHLVSGVHNEALSIGLMMAGIELGVRRLPPIVAGGPPHPLQRGEWTYILLGVVLITLGAAVKIPAATALAFLGVMIARRWGATWKSFLSVAAIFLVVAVATMTLIGLATGLGFGWLGALGTPGMVRSYMSPVAQLANLGGVMGIAMGLGNHTTAVLDVLTPLGNVVATGITAWMIWDSFKGRRSPMTGLGVSLAAALILLPSLQPWYLLYAVIPLSASMAGTKRFRTLTAIGCTIFAISIPPPGSSFIGRAHLVPLGYLTAGLVLAIMLVLLNRKLEFWPRLARLTRRPSRRTRQTPAQTTVDDRTR